MAGDDRRSAKRLIGRILPRAIVGIVQALRNVIPVDVRDVPHHHAHLRTAFDQPFIHCIRQLPAVEPADDDAIGVIIVQDLNPVVFRSRNVQLVAHSAMRTSTEQPSSGRMENPEKGSQRVAWRPK